MTSNASVLVCNDPRSVNQEKLRHASQWSVPAVSSDWIWDSIRAGQTKSFQPYMVKRQPLQGDKAVDRRDNSLNSHTSQVIQLKQGSKDKEVEEIKEDTPDVPQEKPLIDKPPKTTEDNNIRPENQQIPQMRSSSSQSRSPSLRKEQNQTKDTSSVRRQDSEQSTASAAALDLAVNGLLKQARAASSRSTTDSNEQNDGSNNGNNIRQRKRKPLLGRAPSLSSTRNFSRASSVDTLNEDGCGSGVESLTTDKNAGTSRTNSRNGPQQQQQQQQSFSSLFNGSKFDFDPEAVHRGNLGDVTEDDGGGEGDEEPPMTQLNYEDPDAVAMRQQFLRKAGKLVDEDPQESQTVVVGEMRELEDTGWGTGRRTRKATAGKATDGLEKF